MKAEAKPEAQIDQSQIISIAINIFQNVGIKRWIDEIEILKHEQIYFQICKIIFPQTMIDIFRLKENQKLTTGQKIQGVINLTSKLLKHDLHHISGQAISEGKLVHLRNFLQLFEALSDSLTKEKIQDVKSAPQNDQSISGDMDHGNHTVIGMDKQFEEPYYDQSQQEYSDQKPELKQNKIYPKKNKDIKSDEESNEEAPMNPKNNIRQSKKDIYSNRKKKNVKFNIPSSKNTSGPRRTPTFTPSSQVSKEIFTYPIPFKIKKQNNLEVRNKKCINFVKKTHQYMYELEKKKIYDMNQNYQTWKNDFSRNFQKVKEKIQHEGRKRTQYINHKIVHHEEILNSLKGQEKAIEAIKSLFIQQKKLHLNLLKKRHEEFQYKGQDIFDFSEFDNLFQNAIKSSQHRSRDCHHQLNQQMMA